MSKEMQARGRAYGNYRYRRFQALDDCLNLFFYMRSRNHWFTVREICEAFEYDPESNSNTRRVRRICEALERCGRVEVRRAKNRPLFIRVINC